MKITSKNSRTLQFAGFTLVELLVVIAIIGILCALTASSVSRVKESGRRLACESNLRQVNLAIRLYADDSGGALPVLPDPNPYPNGVGAYYKELVKGYLGLSGPPAHDDKVFACPSDRIIHTGPVHAFTSYTFNGYEVGPKSMPRITGHKFEDLGNPTRAVVVGEWTAYFGGSWHPYCAKAYEDAKNMLSFADGHADFVKIYWNGVWNSEPRDYEPPAGYQYSWDGE
jgi:prepilin-type N-terminal cleavage/methylation domain-containing protein